MLVPPARHAGLDGHGEGRPQIRVGPMLGGVRFNRRRIGDPFRAAAMHEVQSLRHTCSGQGAHVGGFSLFEELRDIRLRDGVADQPGFQPTQPEGREHQQCRNEGHEQPRHKGQVNTPKVSARLRITYAVERDSG